MPKKSKLLGLAAIIPTYSNVSASGDCEFSITYPIYKTATILDSILSNCRFAGVKSVILVCKPEQLLYLKSRYGDVLTFNKKGELDRVITMFYITVSSRYCGKYDTVFFNLIYGANILSETTLDSFGVEYSNYYLLIDPRHIFDPIINTRVFNPIKEYLYNGIFGDMLFAHEGIYLPNHSYSFITTATVKALWAKIKSLIKEKNITLLEFYKLTFSSLYNELKVPERVFNLQFPTFDLFTWEDYVNLISYIQSSSQDLREFFYRCCQFNIETLSKSKFSRPLLEIPFSQKVIEFNASTKLWNKTRKELRKNESNNIRR